MKRFFALMAFFSVLFCFGAGDSAATDKKAVKKSESAECMEISKKIAKILTARKNIIIGAKIEDYKLLVWKKTASANGDWVLFKIPLDVNLSDKNESLDNTLVLITPGITRTFERADKETPFPAFSVQINSNEALKEFVSYLKQAQKVCKNP